MPGDLVPERRDLRASHDDRDQVVELLRVAAGDGRLTAEELDERLEAALTARTYGELERLVADLPAEPGGTAPARAADAPEPKELVQLKSRSGNIRRAGPWVVPRRLEVSATSGNITVDLTQAVITRPALDLAVSLRSGNFLLIVPPGVAVDVDDVELRSGNLRQRVHHTPGTPLALRITVSGYVNSGNVIVRGPRRPLWSRFRRNRKA